MIKNKNLTLSIVISLAVISLILKALFASIGYTPDMDAWFNASKIMQEGKVVYANTELYNYGPVWAYIMGLLGVIASALNLFHPKEFHIITAVFLGLIDIAISYVIYKIYGKAPALIYLINPISILLTGYHSQIDNIAVLLAFSSWYFYLEAHKDKDNNKPLLKSAILFGFSLMAKHILVFFPIWMLLVNDYVVIPLKKKIAYFCLSFSIFFSGFLIEYIRAGNQKPETLAGIASNVFGYKGFYATSFIVNFINWFTPAMLVDQFFQFVPIFKGFVFIFLVIVSIIGYLYIRKDKTEAKNILPMYLLVFFAFSVSMADQYIAIALPSIAIFYSNPISIVFLITCFVLLTSGISANVKNLQFYPINLNLFKMPLPYWPWNMTHYIKQGSTQFIAVSASIYLLFNIPSFNIKPSRYFKITLWILGLLVLNLVLYLFIKFTPSNDPKIQITSATYGENCNAKYGNITGVVAERCNGQTDCTFTASAPIARTFCLNDLKINWHCEKDLIQSEYLLKIDGEANGKEVKLLCPGEVYDKYALPSQ